MAVRKSQKGFPIKKTEKTRKKPPEKTQSEIRWEGEGGALNSGIIPPDIIQPPQKPQKERETEEK